MENLTNVVETIGEEVVNGASEIAENVDVANVVAVANKNKTLKKILLGVGGAAGVGAIIYEVGKKKGWFKKFNKKPVEAESTEAVVDQENLD